MGGAYSIHRNFIVRAVSELTRRDSSSPRRLGVVISEPLSRKDRAKRDSRADNQRYRGEINSRVRARNGRRENAREIQTERHVALQLRGSREKVLYHNDRLFKC